jgi:hypothetical protein
MMPQRQCFSGRGRKKAALTPWLVAAMQRSACGYWETQKEKLPGRGD